MIPSRRRARLSRSWIGAAAHVGGALMLSLAPQAAAAQHGTIVGRIVDSLTGEPRPGALVTVPAAALVATTNEHGQFVVARVSVGSQTVQIRAIGYQAVVRRVVVRQADTTRLDVALSRDPMMLDAVRANAPFAEREFFEAKPDVGAVRITARAMESVPRIGEADVVRVSSCRALRRRTISPRASVCMAVRPIRI